MSQSTFNLYTVNVVTGEVADGWTPRPGGAWRRTSATTPEQAKDETMRGHLAEARTALAVEERAPAHLRELHDLEQARAFLVGHVPGCPRFDLEASRCPCDHIEPEALALITAELLRKGTATQAQLSEALGLPSLSVRAALICLAPTADYVGGGLWTIRGTKAGTRVKASEEADR